MFEYQLVGELSGVESGHRLLQPDGRPLSYLRVATGAESTLGLTRALLEHRATELRLRIPLALARNERKRIATALERRRASAVFPVLDGIAAGGAEVDVCWLDWVQMRTVAGDLGTGFARSAEPITVGGLEISPSFILAAGGKDEVLRNWQYWNSDWEFASPPAQRDEWWRVRPNESRERPRLRWLPGAGSPRSAAQARGTFAACLHPAMLERLGKPRYIVVGHPFRRSWLPVLALADEFEGKGSSDDEHRGIWEETIFLDRTAREALGIADGEFCLVYPWLSPRRSIWWRSARDRVVGSRMIAAHVRAPARADLEKPVCRLEPEALEAIGGRAGERVTIEHLAPAGDQPSDHWRRVSLTQRVLPINPAERAERAGWESPQLWDEASTPQAGGGEAPGLEGYVDCAERLGVHPPYPSIYLNYYTRRSGLEGVGLCQPVQVRVGVPGRLTAEASEFAWLVVIALLGAAIAFIHSDTWQIVAAALLAVVTVWLVTFRAIQAIR